MRQAIVVLVSFIVFLGSSGLLVAMSHYYGGYLLAAAARRVGSRQLASADRPFGFEAFFPGVKATLVEDRGSGRRTGEIAREYPGLAVHLRERMPSVTLRPVMRNHRGGQRHTWFPDINVAPFVKMENEKAAHFHALLSSRHDRFSDDS